MKSSMTLLLSLSLSLVLIVLISLIALPAPALAGEAADPLVLVLVGFLEATVFPLIAAVVAGFAVLVLRKLADKYGLEMLLTQEHRLRELAHQGVALAEEMAAKRLKAAKVKLPGGDKMHLAASHILAAAPEISRAQAEALVESVLGRIRGAGATGDKAV